MMNPDLVICACSCIPRGSDLESAAREREAARAGGERLEHEEKGVGLGKVHLIRDLAG